MIPTQMAELILRYGGLTEWINSDEKRLQIFWKMVREQAASSPPQRRLAERARE
jgi:hypothetical protein